MYPAEFSAGGASEMVVMLDFSNIFMWEEGQTARTELADAELGAAGETNEQ